MLVRARFRLRVTQFNPDAFENADLSGHGRRFQAIERKVDPENCKKSVYLAPALVAKDVVA